MDDYPEHNKKANGLPYDVIVLLQEKEQMRQEHNRIQKDFPKPIPFDVWYNRTWSHSHHSIN